MIVQDKRLVGGVAAAVLVAAAGGFTIARYTADTPATPATEGAAQPGETKAEAAPSDTLAMSAEMLKNTGITTETVNPGGLAAEIMAQATIAPSPTGEAIVTARAGGAVTRVLKRLGDPVRRGRWRSSRAATPRSLRPIAPRRRPRQRWRNATWRANATSTARRSARGLIWKLRRQRRHRPQPRHGARASRRSRPT
jgi:hypothetical protein